MRGVEVNRYAYAGNDPINNSDPGGHVTLAEQQRKNDIEHGNTAGPGKGGGNSGLSGGSSNQGGSGQRTAYEKLIGIGKPVTLQAGNWVGAQIPVGAVAFGSISTAGMTSFQKATLRAAIETGELAWMGAVTRSSVTDFLNSLKLSNGLCNDVCRPGEEDAFLVRIAEGYYSYSTPKAAAYEFARFIRSYFSNQTFNYEMMTYIYEKNSEFGYGAI
jgi:hypothetical protein